MNVSKKIRLLEKLAQMPPQAAMPPEAAAPQGPPAEAAAPEEMPGGDPEGAEEKLQTLMETLSGAAGDAAKFDAGNSAAGTRLRKKALQAAKQLKSLRAEVQATKGSRKEEKAQAVMAALQQAAGAQQEQERAEAAMDKAPADKLFNPSQGGEPPQPAPPQMMPPKMASIDKQASWRAALGRGMRNLGIGVGKADETSKNMLQKGFGDLTLGEKAVGLGLGAGALTAGIRGTDAAIDSITGPMKERKAFNNMIAENPSLARENQGDVKKIFRTLHNFNPDMAKDPLVAGSFMRRSLQYKDEGIQPQDVKTLAEIGKLRADTKKKETLLQAMLGAGLSG